MFLKLTAVFFLIFTTVAFASHPQYLGTLGMSPKGQFVAVEEYGYQALKHTYYVTIKIMNVWKKEYVGSTIQVELSASRPGGLQTVRDQARTQASDEFKKFNISG
jgi:predicted secreted protein